MDLYSKSEVAYHLRDRSKNVTRQSVLLASEGEETLATDERWLLVQRIVASPQLQKATQLREILQYITRRSLLEQIASISEYSIAQDVLGRRGNFDPTDDNIVRVQMAHLRRRLELYFSTDGTSETLSIQIPKGTYVPRFEERIAPSVAPLVLAQPRKLSDTVSPRAATPAAARRLYIPAAVAIAGSLALAFLAGRWSKQSSASGSANLGAIHNPLLKRIFVSDLPVSVVVADTNLVVLQNTLHTDITLDQYLSRGYPENILKSATNPEQREILSVIAWRKFTSLADLNVSAKCIELGREFGARTTIRYARSMNARDFEKGNFILIGSRTADPWVELFEPHLNFAFEEDPVTHIFHFRNRHPLPDEQQVYQPDTGGRVSTESYVDIAIVPNLTKTGYVLLLNGATADANEAATELLFKKDLPPALTKLYRDDPGMANQSIEIFLRNYAVDGVVDGFEVVGVRKLP